MPWVRRRRSYSNSPLFLLETLRMRCVVCATCLRTLWRVGVGERLCVGVRPKILSSVGVLADAQRLSALHEATMAKVGRSTQRAAHPMGHQCFRYSSEGLNTWFLKEEPADRKKEEPLPGVLPPHCAASARCCAMCMCQG